MSSQETSQDLSSLLTWYRFAAGIGIPLAISLIGVLGKKLARGKGWRTEDWYLGSELSLAGVSGALVNLVEFLKPERTTFGVLEKKLLGGNLGIALLGLMIYILILSCEQDYGPTSGQSLRKQRMVMLGGSNALGLFTLIGALLLMMP